MFNTHINKRGSSGEIVLHTNSDDENPVQSKYKINEVDFISPFSNLRSNLVTANVLSYYGFDKEVMNLMLSLSKNSRQFITANSLKGFLMKSEAVYQLSWVINFNREFHSKQEYCFPKPVELKNL